MLEEVKLKLLTLSRKILAKKNEIQTNQLSTYNSIIENLAQKEIINESDKNTIKMVLSQQLQKNIDTTGFIKRIQLLHGEVDISNNEFLLEDQYIKQINQDKIITNQTKKQSPSLKKIKKVHEVRRLEAGVEQNPEYFRIDHEICHKIYQIYRKSSIGALKQGQSSSFDEKQQINSTMNYHKIMEIFKDMNIKLEVSQKLQLLRGIKKFSFNQNYINEEEFTKIFKIIVHSLGFKETDFKNLIKEKVNLLNDKQYSSNKKQLTIKLNKNIAPVRKLKTQNQQINFKSLNNILPNESNEEITQSFVKSHLFKKSQLRPLVQITQHPLTLVKPQKIKNRIETENNQSRVSRVYDSAPKGYLNRAMQKNKISKITWESLYAMTEENLNPNVSIPNILNDQFNRNHF